MYEYLLKIKKRLHARAQELKSQEQRLAFARDHFTCAHQVLA